MNVRKGDLAFIVGQFDAGAIVEVGEPADLSSIGFADPCWHITSRGSPLAFWHTIVIDGVVVKRIEVRRADGICPDANLRAIRGELDGALREKFDSLPIAEVACL